MHRLLLSLVVATVTAMPQSPSNRITGSGTESIVASTLGSDGSVYLVGSTNSPDFPVTIPAQSMPTSESYRAFVVKLGGKGEVVYATLLPAAASNPRGIAVNGKGEVLVGGQSREMGFPFTPGAIGQNNVANSGFLIKLDATGARILVALRGYGMGPVAYDAADNLYVAGSVFGDEGVGPTPGAFQASHSVQVCAGGPFFGIPCSYQYVAKISADGTRLIYSTFLTGSFGATAATLLIDAEGNAVVAGTTNSRDYPTTEGAFQREYRVTAVPRPVISPRPTINPPPPTAFISKLNATGTGLVWSTFYSGTGAENVRSLRLTEAGDLFLTGLSQSRDLAGSQWLPGNCPLGTSPDVPYAAALSGDGRTLRYARYVNDIDGLQAVRVLVNADGTPRIERGGPAELDFSSSGLAYVCMVDSADNARLTQVAPGQLVTVFGEFAPGTAVRVDGIDARVLYASAEQINWRAPETLREGETVEMELAGMRRSVFVARQIASAFLDLREPIQPQVNCGGQVINGYAPIARNEDGSMNSCESPAERGSVVTLFLNGIGNAEAPQAVLSQSGRSEVVAFEPDTDSPVASVWKLRIRLAPEFTSGTVTPIIDGRGLRYSPLVVWVRR